MSPILLKNMSRLSKIIIFISILLFTSCRIIKFDQNIYRYSSEEGDRSYKYIKDYKKSRSLISASDILLYRENVVEIDDSMVFTEKVIYPITNFATYSYRKRRNIIQIGYINSYEPNKKVWTDLYSFNKLDTIVGITLWSTHTTPSRYTSRIYVKDTLLTIDNVLNSVECYLFKEIVDMTPETKSYHRNVYIDKRQLLPVYIETYRRDEIYKEYLLKL